MTDLSDPATFARIYRRHHRRVVSSAWRVVRDRELAEDLAQDVFAWLWRHPRAYDGRVSLPAYLAMVTRSRAIDALRSAGARSRLDERLRLEVTARAAPAAEDAVLRSIVRRDDARQLRARVMELAPAQRQALALVYWGDLPTAAVAARLGLPHGTVKSRVRLARERLARRLAPA
jgi:RNA polymerase sigma-70 factor (ECF subfamily)